VLRISADGQGVATMGRTEEREWGDRASPEIDYGNVSPRAAALLLGTRETALASAPEILMRVVPGVAIIRGDALAGSRLQGSHPREQLQSHPTRVFRTDSDGAVTIQINRDGLRVQCYAHACLAP